MSKQTLNIGSIPNDGTGDTLRVASTKTNDNFTEIYNEYGNGTTLDSSVLSVGYASTAGVSTFSQGLIGGPNITVGVATASEFHGDGSAITNIKPVGIASTETFIFANASVTGVITSSTIDSGNINSTGIVTATGGFISTPSITPVSITWSGTDLTFTVAGVGSTTLTLF